MKTITYENCSPADIFGGRFQEKVYGRVWYITAEGYESLLMKAGNNHPIGIERDERGCNAKRPTRDAWGDEIAQPYMTAGNVAVIPVCGPLMKGATGFDKRFGVCAHEDIHEDISIARSRARAAVMMVDSTGGTVLGTQGVAEHVADIQKSGFPIYSYTEGSMCSAAEYITGACTARFATSDAFVGSIGTMMATVSIEKLLTKVGIEFNIFASGKYKGMGHMAKDLTPDQRDFLQQFVNDRAAEFKAHMVQYRTTIKPEAMQGQFFTGSDAIKNGLIDATVRDLGEVLAMV